MLGVAVSIVAVAFPLAFSILDAVLVGHVVPRGSGLGREVLWWGSVLGSSTVAFIGLERFSRRLLPLAALLKMTLLTEPLPRLTLNRLIGTLMLTTC